MSSNRMKAAVIPATFFTLLTFPESLRASTIIIAGVISQDTFETGSPATANPELNNVLNGDSYNVTLSFGGDIAAPGTYALTSILLDDAAAGSTESAFISGSITITETAGVDQFSVLGCLIDAATCLLGNQLALNFQIPAAGLNQAGITAQAIPGLLPLDLLEDDGSTDIQASVTGYSYTGAASQAPEPSTLGLIGVALITLATIRKKTTNGGKQCQRMFCRFSRCPH